MRVRSLLATYYLKADNHSMEIGKLFIFLGVVLVAIGIAVNLGFRGLPGDIVIKRENSVFFFPIATSIALSLIISLVLLLTRR